MTKKNPGDPQNEGILTREEVMEAAKAALLPEISDLYGLAGYAFRPVSMHEGGRNVLFTCEKAGNPTKILRISYLQDRSREDILAETEFVRYLYEHGAGVANVLSSCSGNLVEEITHLHRTFFICLFDQAKGKRLVDNHYRYRAGVPITEYYFNCGKTLGKIHQLSKAYVPVHHRYDFFDKYTVAYIEDLIPGSLSLLRERMTALRSELRELDADGSTYGLIHFDYNDGNYHIDFGTGNMTVYDFDNACYCWYLYDLASLWINGTGWAGAEQDAAKREQIMKAYFETVLSGYRTETEIEEGTLRHLPLFIKALHMESILDYFQCLRDRGESISACEEWVSYLMKCLEEDIPYQGFFHDVYSCEDPFEWEPRILSV